MGFLAMCLLWQCKWTANHGVTFVFYGYLYFVFLGDLDLVPLKNFDHPNLHLVLLHGLDLLCVYN